MRLKIKIYTTLLLFFLLSACTDHYELKPIINWTKLNNFPGTARASATSFVYGDNAYVCLGRSGAKYEFLKDLWEYDSKADSWTRKSDFPGAARVKAIAGVIGDKAYVGLGAVSAYEGHQFSDLWEYNMATDTWKQMASFPGEGKNDLFCAVVDSCLYTTAGFAATNFNPDSYKYDPKANSWSKLTDFPIVRSSTAGFSIADKIYIGTGYRSGNNKDFYCYSTPTDSWNRLADAPEGRILSKGIAINGKGYLLLGRSWNGKLDGGKLLKDIIEYDPLTNKWSRCGDFTGGGRQNMVAFTINGKGYVVGGEDDKERKTDVWVFTTPNP